MTSMVIISQENERQEEINKITSQFSLTRITYNGQEGYFIPFTGYQQLRYIINHYLTLKEIIVEKDKTIARLEKFEKINFRLKTALGVSISINVGSIFLNAGMGIMCYNLAKTP